MAAVLPIRDLYPSRNPSANVLLNEAPLRMVMDAPSMRLAGSDSPETIAIGRELPSLAQCVRDLWGVRGRDMTGGMVAAMFA
jgi:hypothetical protein